MRFTSNISRWPHGPGDTWVFADEHPDLIDDGIFYLDPEQTTKKTGIAKTRK